MTGSLLKRLSKVIGSLLRAWNIQVGSAAVGPAVCVGGCARGCPVPMTKPPTAAAQPLLPPYHCCRCAPVHCCRCCCSVTAPKRAAAATAGAAAAAAQELFSRLAALRERKEVQRRVEVAIAGRSRKRSAELATWHKQQTMLRQRTMMRGGPVDFFTQQTLRRGGSQALSTALSSIRSNGEEGEEEEEEGERAGRCCLGLCFSLRSLESPERQPAQLEMAWVWLSLDCALLRAALPAGWRVRQAGRQAWEPACYGRIQLPSTSGACAMAGALPAAALQAWRRGRRWRRRMSGMPRCPCSALRPSFVTSCGMGGGASW